MVGRDLRPVPGDADEAHEPLLAGLHRGLDHAARTQRGVPVDRVGEVVELPEVDVVHAHSVERAMQLLACLGRAACAGLGGDEEAAGVALEPRRDAQLGVAVAGSGVDVVDAVLHQQIESAVGRRLIDAAQRRRTKKSARAVVTGTAKRDLLYRHLSFIFVTKNRGGSGGPKNSSIHRS